MTNLHDLPTSPEPSGASAMFPKTDAVGEAPTGRRGVLEIAIGSAVVAGAGIVWMLTGGVLGPSAEAVSNEPTVEAVRAGDAAGIDVTGGGPQKMRDRLVGQFEAGNFVPFSEVAFVDGLYTRASDDALLTAYVADTYPAEDGFAPRLICSVVNGRLEGPACELYPDGTIKKSLTFRGGRVTGQMLDFFPSGEMKLRVVAGGQASSGGTRVSEVTAGLFEDGAYTQRSLGTGRMQFIFDDGTTNFTNDSMPVDEQTGYMLFYDSMLGQKVYTTDSRRITK